MCITHAIYVRSLIVHNPHPPTHSKGIGRCVFTDFLTAPELHFSRGFA